MSGEHPICTFGYSCFCVARFALSESCNHTGRLCSAASVYPMNSVACVSKHRSSEVDRTSLILLACAVVSIDPPIRTRTKRTAPNLAT